MTHAIDIHDSWKRHTHGPSYTSYYTSMTHSLDMRSSMTHSIHIHDSFMRHTHGPWYTSDYTSMTHSLDMQSSMTHLMVLHDSFIRHPWLIQYTHARTQIYKWLHIHDSFIRHTHGPWYTSNYTPMTHSLDMNSSMTHSKVIHDSFNRHPWLMTKTHARTLIYKGLHIIRNSI